MVGMLEAMLYASWLRITELAMSLSQGKCFLQAGFVRSVLGAWEASDRESANTRTYAFMQRRAAARNKQSPSRLRA